MCLTRMLIDEEEGDDADEADEDKDVDMDEEVDRDGDRRKETEGARKRLKSGCIVTARAKTRHVLISFFLMLSTYVTHSYLHAAYLHPLSVSDKRRIPDT